jgi:hypothetical protein
MPNKDSFKKIIAGANSGKRFPVLSLVRDDPQLAATLSKLIPSSEPARYSEAGNREPVAPNAQMFKNTSEHIAQNVSDARTVLQILPDMELAAQILVSSIISPKDMMTTELTYTLADGLISPDVSAAMITLIKAYFETDYKIKPLLPKMLRDMLFETGSYPIAVIPENSIDELINGSHRITFEGLSDTLNKDGSIKPLGLLGPAIKNQPSIVRSSGGFSMEALDNFTPDKGIDCKVTLESIFTKPVDTFLTVTDNHNLLKIPQINQKIREQRIKGVIGSKAMESIATTPSKHKLNDREMTSLVYKERQFNYKPISVLKTQEQLNRRTVGNPLVLHLPSESVIPVYVPGCVEEQVGFFVLIDADGNPVSKAADADYYQQLSSRLNSNGSFPSAMLTQVKSQMNGFNSNNVEHMNYATRAYGDMVEQDLLARLRNGVYGNGVALANNTEIYRLMFARALAKQHTQLLFIPVELMTYFAFKHTAEGIGQSLLEDMKILNSLRSMLLFANVMASLKNSIGRTEVKIKLDDSDPNPQKTIEATIHEITRSRQQYFPLGMNSPTDLTDWLQRSGFEFTFEGHPGLPDVSVDFGEKASNYNKPDTELEESLRKRAIMATGLSPETVDATFQAEFATSIVTNNILLAKRVIQMQEQFTPQLANHLRKCVMNSEQLVDGLRKILVDNFDKLGMELKPDGTKVEATKDQSEGEKKNIVNGFLNEFIMNFEVTLPLPNSVTLETQMAAMETYTKALDASLEAWISEKFFTTDTGGQVANQVATIKEVLKAYYLRKWMTENGVMPELNSLTTVGEDGAPAVDVYKVQEAHIEGLTKALSRFMVAVAPVKEASDTVLNSIGGAGEAAPTSTDDSSSSEEVPAGEDEVPEFDIGETDDEPTDPDAKPDDKVPEPEAKVDDETKTKDEGEEKDKEVKVDVNELDPDKKVE